MIKKYNAMNMMLWIWWYEYDAMNIMLWIWCYENIDLEFGIYKSSSESDQKFKTKSRLRNLTSCHNHKII